MSRTKRFAVHAALAAILAAALNAPAGAESAAFEMKPGSTYSDDTAETKIIGGTKANPSDWPATFVFRDPRGGSCTSTAIGERVILTAAHCIGNGSQGIVQWDGQSLITSCHHHPGYQDVPRSHPQFRTKVSPDFALCFTQTPMTQIMAENVDRSGDMLKVGDELRLLGFGCNKEGGTDGGFGVLYEGNSPIKLLPTNSYYTETESGAAVCYGDSGGGAFLFLNPAKTRRLLMGVNSRGDISKLSLLSTTSVKGFVDWADGLAKQNSTTICGLHDAASGCRPR